MNRAELKQALLRGGLYLSLRQALTMVLSMISVLVITRTLGPEHYGWIVIAISFNILMTNLADLGLKVYLIRKPGDCPKQLQQEVLALLIIMGTILALSCVLTAPLIAVWTKIPELRLILLAMAPAILIDTCVGAPLGMLERTLQYQRSSFAEIGSLLLYYAAAIPLVLLGWDVWGIVVAHLLRSILQAVIAFVSYPIRPIYPKNFKELQRALYYGIGFSGAMWIVQGRGLIIPLLLGRFIGTEAVGLVGATNRIADMLAFVKAIAWQLGISGFAKLQEDPSAMRNALSRAMTYQTFLLLPPLGLFTCLSPILVPLVLGHKWNGIVDLFPFVAFVFLMKGVFDLHALVLFSMGRNLDVFTFNLVSLGIISSAIAVLGNALHIWGYAAAEIISLIAFVLLHLRISRIIGSPSYKPVVWIIICTLFPFLVGNRFPFFISVPLLLAGFGIASWLSREVRTTGRELLAILTQKVRPT
jgi:O-antigen/teichoic acid export membrane protein